MKRTPPFAVLAAIMALALVGLALPASAAPPSSKGTIGFDSATYSVTENAGPAVVTVTRTTSTGKVTVTLTTSDGTATAGSDYTTVNTKVTLAAGATSATVNVPILNDTVAELAQTVNLALSGVPSTYTAGITAAVLTITDDDAPAVPAGLTATAVPPDKVDLAWAAPTDHVTAYTVGRSDVSGGPYTEVGTATGPSYQDTVASPGTYYYAVKASNPAGSSAYSGEASATVVPTTLFANGGFETGGLAPWVAGSEPFGGGPSGPSIANALSALTGPTTLAAPAAGDTVAPPLPMVQGTVKHSGDWALQAGGEGVGGTPYGISYAYQDVVVPDEATAVHFWYRTEGDGYPGVIAALPVDNWFENANFYSALGLPPKADWTETTVGLAPAAGRTVRLVFAMIEVNGAASLFVDDVDTAVAPPPAAPALTAAATGPFSVHASWTPVEGATAYDVMSSRQAGGPYSMETEVPGDFTEYDLTGLYANTTLYLIVRSTFVDLATNTYVTSVNSNEVEVTTEPFTMPPPTDLKAELFGSAGVYLTWTPVEGAWYYNVYRSNGAGGPYVYHETTGGNGYVDVDVLADTTYYYVVTAYQGGAESAYSNEASITTPPPYPVPSNVLAVADSPYQVTVSWDAVPGAVAYDVFRGDASGGPYYERGPVTEGTSFIDTGNSPGTTYFFVVKAMGPNGEVSAYSAEAAVTTPFGAPTSVWAWASGARRVTVAWSAVGGALSYQVGRSDQPGGPYTVVADQVTGTAFVDTSVAPSATYYYAVKAFSADQESSWSYDAGVVAWPYTYFETFDSGAAEGWSANGLWHLVGDSPSPGQRVRGAQGYSSYPFAFYYGIDASSSFDTGDANKGMLTSPPIAVESGRDVVLSWRTFYDGEAAYLPSWYDYDAADVYVSFDGGIDWQLVWSMDETQPARTWAEASATFTAGSDSMLVRFMFNTLDGGLNDYLGWLIDDVGVTQP